MRNALLSEYRKLVTTRMWWFLLLCMTAYMAFLAVLMGVSLTVSDSGPDTDPEAVARGIYALSAAFGYVFPALTGALSITGEFRHQTITPTLLATPDRSRLLLAKLIAAVPVGLFYGLAGTLACVGAGASALALTDNPTYLGSSAAWATIGLSVIALTVWTVVGVGIGAALRNQVAVIIVLLVFTQFVEPIARAVLAAADGIGPTVAMLLPGAVGEAITGASFYSTVGLAELLPWWAGVLVLLGYGVALAAIGRLTTLSRDIT